MSDDDSLDTSDSLDWSTPESDSDSDLGYPTDFPQLHEDMVTPALRAAIIMGIEPTSTGDYLVLGEQQREAVWMKHVQPMFGTDDYICREDEQHLAMFCIGYLDQLVDKVCRPPTPDVHERVWEAYPAWNAYSVFLTNLLRHNAYCVKYFAPRGRQSHKTRLLAQQTVARLLDIVPRRLDDGTRTGVLNVCYMLWLILVHTMDDTYTLPMDVPQVRVAELVQVLRTWLDDPVVQNNESMRNVVLQPLIDVLEGRKRNAIFRFQLEALSGGHCARPGCSVSNAKQDLYQCGR